MSNFASNGSYMKLVNLVFIQMTPPIMFIVTKNILKNMPWKQLVLWITLLKYRSVRKFLCKSVAPIKVLVQQLNLSSSPSFLLSFSGNSSTALVSPNLFCVLFLLCFQASYLSMHRSEEVGHYGYSPYFDLKRLLTTSSKIRTIRFISIKSLNRSIGIPGITIHRNVLQTRSLLINAKGARWPHWFWNAFGDWWWTLLGLILYALWNSHLCRHKNNNNLNEKAHDHRKLETDDEGCRWCYD